IYHVDTTGRTAKAPHEYYGAKVTDWVRETFETRRGPSSDPIPMPGDNLWRWVGETLRNWLLEKEPDRNWPHAKPDRISGYIGARWLLRPGSQTDYVWTVLGKADVYRDSRIYRIQRPAYEERIVGGLRQRVPPENPGVLWVGRQDMRSVPLDDLDKHMGVP